MLSTKIVLNVRHNFCTQHVVPRFELLPIKYELKLLSEVMPGLLPLKSRSRQCEKLFSKDASIISSPAYVFSKVCHFFSTGITFSTLEPNSEMKHGTPYFSVSGFGT